MNKRFQALFFVSILLVTAIAATSSISRTLSVSAAASVPSLGAGRILLPLFDPLWGSDVMVDPLLADNHENFSLAINPTDSNKILASYKYEDENGSGSGYDLSTDAGHTWNGSRFSGPWGADLLSPIGNTSVGFNARGTAFYSGRAANSEVNGLFVLTSTDAVNWGAPVEVITSTNAELRDQLHLAVDQRTNTPNAGSAFLIWRWFSGDNLGIWMSYSRDSARTWSPGVQVSDAANHYSSGPSIAVASNGVVYAAFQQRDNDCPCSAPKLFLDRSTDWGVTWGADRLITGAPITKTGALDVEGHDLVIIGQEDPVEGGLEVNNYSSMAVAPNDSNTVYVAWNDGRWDTSFTIFQHEGKHGDIAFSRTTDAGQTWSAPMRINDDQIANGVDQFTPTIATGPDGTIGVTWYDRRLNPGGYLYDLFYSQSTDGGLTWSPNQRVSDVSSDPMIGVNAKGMGDMGEYKALALGPNYVIPSWIDTRSGVAQDFYSDRGCALPFSDVIPSDYFYTAVQYLYCAGAISGYSDNTFRPYNNTTRGQLSKIIVLAEGWPIDTSGGPHFTDVPPGSAFYDFVETAFNRGAVSGYGDGTFRPDNNVTRAQLCKIIVLAEGWTIDITGGPHFSDVVTGDPFYGYIETAYNHNIISGYGDGTFRPDNNATRGQISKIVYNSITTP